MDTPKLSISASLRLLADWYEKNPDMPAPTARIFAGYGNGLGCPDGARRIAKILGTFEKGGSDLFLILIKQFGAVTLEVEFYREDICKKRVVQEEIVEWDCPSLLAPAEDAA